MKRPGFKFPGEVVDLFIEILMAEGEQIIAAPSERVFEDAADKIFFETAITSHCDFLITGNLKHFPEESWIVSPAKFLETIYT